MSWQTAEVFLELLAADRNLQTHQKLADAWTIPALTRFARGKGFIFSEADLKVAMESFTRQPQANKY
ncbi:MAG: Nif11-like leader peptide family natural product precursor [Anaerolineae bacterium]|nr:Nif11-like leader peptide family natural product precursor [Anaerolineae bacterium]